MVKDRERVEGAVIDPLVVGGVGLHHSLFALKKSSGGQLPKLPVTASCFRLCCCGVHWVYTPAGRWSGRLTSFFGHFFDIPVDPQKDAPSNLTAARA